VWKWLHWMAPTRCPRIRELQHPGDKSAITRRLSEFPQFRHLTLPTNLRSPSSCRLDLISDDSPESRNRMD